MLMITHQNPSGYTDRLEFIRNFRSVAEDDQRVFPSSAESSAVNEVSASATVSSAAP